jgi:hypothetical protein
MGWQNSATIEHLLPISLGGKDTSSNLASSCYRCNQMRDVMEVEEFKIIAKELSIDCRTEEEFNNVARREFSLKRKQILSEMIPDGNFSYAELPDSSLNRKERIRKARALARREFRNNAEVNPFESGSREHKFFESFKKDSKISID